MLRRIKPKQPPEKAAALHNRALFVKPCKEIIVSTVVYLSKLNNHACTDVKLSDFIFCVTASRYIAAATLQFNIEPFLNLSYFRAVRILSKNVIDATLVG